jgi:TonB family protein
VRSPPKALAIAAAALFLVATPVFARQPEPAPPGEAIVPPRPIDPIAPSYPEGAEGDASVLLEVRVESDGTPSDVRAVEGAEPFASKAIEAVRRTRFAAATRAGAPTAATIRFRVDFTKPPPPPEPEPAAEPEPAPAPEPGLAPEPAKPREEGPREVIVRGGKANVNAGPSDTLGRAEVRQLPGAFGDPFRAIEVSPGLTPVLTGLPYYYVRGAPPGNVGYYFEGVRVPYLFHFGLGPAVIHPALIAKTDIYKGGYPAALGRWSGGVVDSSAMPPQDRLHGEGQVRLIDAGALVEAPFAKGKGAALAAGRYSYTAALFNLLQSDTSLDYSDYQARVSYALGERDTVSFLGFGAYDLASQKQLADPTALAQAAGQDPSRANVQPGKIERLLFASEFHRADARWDHAFAGGAKSRVAATLGYDRTRVEARRAAEDLLTAARAEVAVPVSRGFVVRAGADVVVDRYSADALPRYADDDDVVDRQTKIFVSRSDLATGVRADTVLTFVKGLEIVPGVRLDHYESGPRSATAIDPRLAIAVAVNDRVRIHHELGLATQAPSTPVALPAITVANLEGGIQRSFQTSAGVDADVPWDVTMSASVFHNAFYDLNDALGTAQTELVDLERSDSLLAKSRGSAFGLELGARRKLSKRLTGLVSYTLSRSLRRADGRTFVSAYDRTHVANAVVSYDLGRSWRAGGRGVLYTGVPITPPAPAFEGQRVGEPPERTPTFVRLDLRVEKRWPVGKRGWVTFVVEALNATLSREVTGYACGTALVLPGAPERRPSCSERIIGPVTVPSVGVEGGF